MDVHREIHGIIWCAVADSICDSLQDVTDWSSRQLFILNAIFEEAKQFQANIKSKSRLTTRKKLSIAFLATNEWIKLMFTFMFAAWTIGCMFWSVCTTRYFMQECTAVWMNRKLPKVMECNLRLQKHQPQSRSLREIPKKCSAKKSRQRQIIRVLNQKYQLHRPWNQKGFILCHVWKIKYASSNSVSIFEHVVAETPSFRIFACVTCPPQKK